MATTLLDSVVHWRKKLEKNLDEDTILNVIRKLSKIPISLEILELTHIGKTIRKLSKRDDIVGEKALVLLKKWRDIFASADSTVNRNSKLPSVSKKENTNKKSKQFNDVASEKTVHQKETSHKHEQNSFSHSSSQQTITNRSEDNPKDYIKKSTTHSHSIYTYEKKATPANYMDYDPHADVNEGYNPEFPELFPSEKLQTTKKVSGTIVQKSSQKHKLKTDGQAESVSKSKKLNSGSHSNSDSVLTDEMKKIQEKKEKRNSQNDPKVHLTSAKESSHKTKLDNADVKKHKVTSDSKKSKGKECNGNRKTKCDKSKQKFKLNSSEEFTSSEVRFEDCLGFNDIVTLKKKKTTKLISKKTTPTVNNKKTSTRKTCSLGEKIKSPKESKHSFKDKLNVNVPKPSLKLDVVDIVSTLPEIQPNYQPLPPKSLDFYSPKKKEVFTNEDAIRFISSRREKTAVYSGRKSYFTEVPTLFECCTKVLIENIDAIEYMGGVPYYLLKPVLERCTPNQLFEIENYNPNFLESTNELWEIHCRRDYKLLTPEENETWRDLYLRAHDERERKLKSITANISASMSKSNPVRQVKLAFVDSIAKPPRDVARRQAKNGTAGPVNHPVKVGPPSSKSTPKPATQPISSTPSSTPVGLASNNFTPKKPKVAPLMAKTLKSMKQCFRR